MNEEQLKTINEKISAILLEHNCTLQIAHTIQIVPNKPMEEEVTGTEVVEETAEVSGTEETPTEEVAQ
jgi:hypothetical protein